jgi:histidine triad (HIT) family protein
MAECAFCEIVSGRAPANVVYEDERTLAFLDIHPANPGHTLVVPKRHVENVYALSDKDGAAVMSATRDVAAAIREALQPDGLNLFQTNGRAAFQSVFHFHMHLIPRWWDDGLLPPRHGVGGREGDLTETAERIRQALRTLAGTETETDPRG